MKYIRSLSKLGYFFYKKYDFYHKKLKNIFYLEIFTLIENRYSILKKAK